MSEDHVADSVLAPTQDQPGDAEANWGAERPRKPDDDLINYLKGVGGSLGSDLQNEERHALVRNVFEELNGNEASLACSRATSFIVEDIVKEGNDKQLALFLGNLRKYFGFVCTNRQGSHVVQTLLNASYQVLFNPSDEGEDDFDEDDKEENNTEISLKERIIDLGTTLVERDLWWDMMYDPCATHVLRALLCVLGGKDPVVVCGNKAKQQKKRMEYDNTYIRAADKELEEVLQEFMAKMSTWKTDDIKVTCSSSYASPVVQVLISNCSSKKKCWNLFLRKLLSAKKAEGDENDEIDDKNIKSDAKVFATMCKDRIASHVMQAVVSRCDNAIFINLIWSQSIKGHMLEMANHHFANYVLQNALARLFTQEQCEEALAELEEPLTQSLIGNKLGVVWKLCQGVKQCEKAIQSRVARAILKGIRARRQSDGPTQGAIEALLELRLSGADEKKPEAKDEQDQPDTEEHAEFRNVSVSILGSRICNALLEFAPESSRAVLESIASMDPSALRACCLDPVACKYVMEALMDAQLGANWAKQRVLQKLKEDIATLAENKFAWHFVRKSFDTCPIKEKLLVVKTLAKKERRIAGSSYGTKLLKHCKVSLYKKHPDQWKAALTHHDAKKRKLTVDSMMKDLEETQARAKKKSKKKNT